MERSKTPTKQCFEKNRLWLSKIKSFAKSCSPTEYRNATAFEVLIGTLHLLGNEEKIKKILKNFIEGEKNNEEKK